MLQETRTDLLLIRVMLDEVMTDMEALPVWQPGMWPIDSAFNLRGDGVCYNQYEIKNACGAYRCLCGWAAQNEAFKPYVRQYDCSNPCYHYNRPDRINWLETAHAMARAMDISSALFGNNVSVDLWAKAWALPERRAWLEQAYEERVNASAN